METRIKQPELAIETTAMFQNLFQKEGTYGIDELMAQLTSKLRRSFLVFKHNKYFTIPVENIAYFYVKYGNSTIVCMDRSEYLVNYSLDQIQALLNGRQFYRINRQCLINFSAVKEVEHYFARKLLVTLIITTAEKLLVPKEKARLFLDWLENR